jgi:hypothetical protein
MMRWITAFVTLFGGFAAMTVAAQPRQAPPPPLTQQAEIPPDGFTVRFPATWSIRLDSNIWRIINVPQDRAATAEASTLDQLG